MTGTWWLLDASPKLMWACSCCTGLAAWPLCLCARVCVWQEAIVKFTVSPLACMSTKDVFRQLDAAALPSLSSGYKHFLIGAPTVKRTPGKRHLLLVGNTTADGNTVIVSFNLYHLLRFIHCRLGVP